MNSVGKHYRLLDSVLMVGHSHDLRISTLIAKA